ncbi:MAG TPA: amidohydrolase, partial [Bacillota bacterium]|nr:amidohydrolase [Bacillota bacterium]
MAVISNELLLANAGQVSQYVRTVRGHLHQHPEVSGQEYDTSLFLRQELEKLGLPVETVSATGLIAVLDTGREGPTVALRADIDALPMQESQVNLYSTKKFVSLREGVSHTCGHDGHMAMLLGVAKSLTGIKDLLRGSVLFCFEEGEETGSGIDGMMRALSRYPVAAVWGMHLTSFMNAGTISVDPGPRMAGETQVQFDVVGKGGHGSRPDLSINPVFAAAHVLTALGSAWPNRIDANETVTLGIATINGGTAPNIIPDRVRISGT